MAKVALDRFSLIFRPAAPPQRTKLWRNAQKSATPDCRIGGLGQGDAVPGRKAPFTMELASPISATI
jgi:hypothetical protein